MLRQIASKSVRSILECNCNILCNLVTLKELFPPKEVVLIEMKNEDAYRVALDRVWHALPIRNPLQDSSFPYARFDLVFTAVCSSTLIRATYPLRRTTFAGTAGGTFCWQNTLIGPP